MHCFTFIVQWNQWKKKQFDKSQTKECTIATKARIDEYGLGEVFNEHHTNNHSTFHPEVGDMLTEIKTMF